MTINGALSDLDNLLKADDIPFYYKPSIKAVMDTIALEQEPQSFKWCTDCKEYDQEKHCCHRWSKAIRDTVEEMKQEPTLSIDDVMSVFEDFMCGEVDEEGKETFLEMLKNKAESEG